MRKAELQILNTNSTYYYTALLWFLTVKIIPFVLIGKLIKKRYAKQVRN